MKQQKSKNVTISTRTVGQSFGCEGIVKCGSRVIWTSRTFPFGFNGNAYEAAESKAKDEGWTIVSAEGRAGENKR